MVHSTLNYWAVLVAGLAYMILGAIWYSPLLFGNSWMRLIGKTKEQIAQEFSSLNYLWALITSLIAAYGVARILFWTGGETLVHGLLVGLLAGVCFVFMSFVVNDSFENRPRGLTAINVFYHMTGLVAAGVIIGAWR